MKATVSRILPRVRENILGYWQRAYLEKRDPQDLIFCLKTAIDDFRRQSSKFYALFIDFCDAFGSLKQSHMIKRLVECGIEETYCRITADIYQDSHFEGICDQGISKEFNLNIGCKTGEPASPCNPFYHRFR